MLCKDLKVVNLSITEDNYEYKALFSLCAGTDCMDIDLNDISEDKVLTKVKEHFSIEDSLDTMREIIMQKVMEATKLESRISEGENSYSDIEDVKQQKAIDSLNKV